ncbi:hypothetical protein BpHYR1_004931 [Brachionus plicatilis]|uniref:Uncharacterized protein n=1 Tax=Brachionus plicatilis TaxID=10195 RepID=A0A3M7S137_BRAPC|nr:hypothetical protein BpHYR1_004931 [Brachionus plicatilis]
MNNLSISFDKSSGSCQKVLLLCQYHFASVLIVLQVYHLIVCFFDANCLAEVIVKIPFDWLQLVRRMNRMFFCWLTVGMIFDFLNYESNVLCLAEIFIPLKFHHFYLPNIYFFHLHAKRDNIDQLSCFIFVCFDCKPIISTLCIGSILLTERKKFSPGLESVILKDLEAFDPLMIRKYYKNCLRHEFKS